MKQIFKEVFYFTRCNLSPMLKILWPFLLLSICIGIPLDYLGKEGGTGANWIYSLIMMIAQPLYMCRLIKYMNSSATNENLDLDVSFKEWSNLFIIYLLYGAVVVLGSIAFIIPGIYLAARYGFAEFEAVLNQKQPIRSLNDSWVSTKSNLPVLMLGTVIIGGLALIVLIMLLFIGKINMDFSVLTAVISEIVSILTMIFLSVFYFRVYLLNQNSTTDLN